MKDFIRIASGQGFWGDLPNAPVNQAKKGPIDYLVMDYLAEVTMSIMQKQRMRNPDWGYARDFVSVVEQVLPEIKNDGIKVISNAGGVNPMACKDEILKIAKEKGYTDLKVAVVDGDDILDQIDELIKEGHTLNNMDNGKSIAEVKDELLSANVYFGCWPIVEALRTDADVIITGRVTDTGLTLAPMIHEFGWEADDFDKMAVGTIAGHIIECGAQVSGGNFTDWEKVDDFTEIGFPIIEAYPNGDFYVTKHENTGGLISEMTVKEQLLYEIGDPSEYITPDVIADFTSIQVEETDTNRVKITGIKGHPDTPTYKVSASYNDGYKLSATLVYCWPDALKKAVKGAEILKSRAELLDLEFDAFHSEYIGYNGNSEIPVTDEALEKDHDEIQLRVSLSGKSKRDLNRFGMEIAPLILTGPSGVTGFAGGRPKASDVVAYWPALLDKKAVKPRVTLYEID
ncbi:acyclic terpene utilization AtuA family protein [Gracilimonas amylolytica]|uniref:acyclic terpene utilization AtuA family protein n=1 Tax=Gracilimonas amylolytica TaxID=1749045 RepID=UPI000CD93ABB|nr:acyclic terpene utilization AtuA family protein [Gracilimonas amylolytica]